MTPGFSEAGAACRLPCSRAAPCLQHKGRSCVVLVEAFRGRRGNCNVVSCPQVQSSPRRSNAGNGRCPRRECFDTCILTACTIYFDGLLRKLSAPR